MSQKQELNGWIGWAGLVAYIACYDTYAIKFGHETMSHACWDTTSIGRTLIGFSCVLVAKHLIFPNFLPQTDPIGICGKLIRKL